MKKKEIEKCNFYCFIEKCSPKDLREDVVENPVSFLENYASIPENFGVRGIAEAGHFKEMGWNYDLTPFLKKFLVKQYGNWDQYYAINKHFLRKIVPGKIEEIIEICDKSKEEDKKEHARKEAIGYFLTLEDLLNHSNPSIVRLAKGIKKELTR